MMNDSHDSALFLTIPRAAEVLGVSAQRLRRAVELGQIPVVRIGKQSLIPRATIARLAQEDEAR